MEKKKNYPKVLVVNDSNQDVFSEHLSSIGCPVTRSPLHVALQSTELNAWPIILVVNGTDEDAFRIMSRFNSEERPVLASCSGGKKDFQPCLLLWYAPHDCDFINYSSWAGFEDGLFKTQPRQQKLLEFHEVTPEGYLMYQTVDYHSEGETVSNDFASEIKVMAHLSKVYLEYLQGWLKRVQYLSFNVHFELSPKKMFKTMRLEQDLREFEGLPIFQEGDRIVFSGASQQIMASVKMAEEEQITIVLDEKISGQEINMIDCYAVFPAMNAKMMRSYVDYLDHYQESDGRRTNFVPLDLIKGVALNNYDPIRHESEYGEKKKILLDKKTNKILRDRSQIEALLDIMSEKYFSLVEGPGGTGKTFVCAVATKQYFLRGRNVLLLSHSNKGVDNLLEEVAKHLPSKNLFRFGSDVNVMSPLAVKLNSEEHYQEFMSVSFFDNDEPRVMATTINSLTSDALARTLIDRVNVVFIDEATRSLLYENLPAIGKAIEKIVLIGDKKQLGNIKFPPSVVNALMKSLLAYTHLDFDPYQAIEDFNGGLFLLAKKFLTPRFLRYNRRSLPKICRLVSDVFYEGKLEVGRFNPYTEGELIFYDTNGKFPDERYKTSYRNPMEANFLIKKCVKVASANIRAGGVITDFASISPYSAHINLVKKRLRKNLLYDGTIKSQANVDNIDELINELVVTVDAMMGSERKIIFLSLVCSNNEGRIGFNRDIRRLNVAILRPRDKLVIIGDVATFMKCGQEDIVTAFGKIVEFIKVEGTYQVL